MTSRVSLYLDTRRSKRDNLFPVKIRVWDIESGRAKLYPTGYDLSKQDFNSVWKSQRPRREHLDLRRQLEEVRSRALEIIQGAKGGVFSELERKLFRPKDAGNDVFYHYTSIVQKLEKEGRLGTASSYSLSQRSFKRYLRSLRQSDVKLRLDDVDTNWLYGYERFMIQEGKSLTTVGVYLRTLRAVFNTAISENEIERECYPFGRRKYVIPTSRGVKKALSKEELTALFHSEPNNENQIKARDFFFFSYCCNGMNIKDIALLRFEDFDNDSFTFFRAKTLRTTRSNLVPITVFINDFTERVIRNYGNDKSSSPFVFDIVNEHDSNETKRRKIQAFTRFVNQHLKRLANSIGLPKNVSSIWARHSFATSAIRSGQSMDFMREALGHTQQKTTQNYFAGFEDDAKREFAKTLMNFTQ